MAAQRFLILTGCHLHHNFYHLLNKRDKDMTKEQARICTLFETKQRPE